MRGISRLEVQVEETLAAAAREGNSGSEAGDGLVIDAVDVGEDSVLALMGDQPMGIVVEWDMTYGRNLSRQADGLGDAQLALLYGAFQIDVADLLAEVRLGADETDEAVLDLKKDVCTLLDVFLDSAGSLDHEILATTQHPS